jgi:hypothetical protein
MLVRADRGQRHAICRIGFLMLEEMSGEWVA